MSINDLPKEELQKLSNQLCFALYVTSKEVIRKYTPILKPFGLTYTGYITMLSLWEEDSISVSKLGKKLYLDSGTLTPLLKKLESKGFLTRKRSKEDERSVYIYLTKIGAELKTKTAAVPITAINSSPFDISDAAEILKKLQKYMPEIE